MFSSSHYIYQAISQARDILNTMLEDSLLIDKINQTANYCIQALQRNNKILLCGNGGSAADCQHIAGELVGRFSFDRSGLPAIALTTDTSILTAIGNDYGYDRIFARQVEALGQAGDILLAYSTSGTSANIVQAIQSAQNLQMLTIGLCGNRENTPMLHLCTLTLQVPSINTPEIQQGHAVIDHIICGLIEKTLFA